MQAELQDLKTAQDEQEQRMASLPATSQQPSASFKDKGLSVKDHEMLR
jgi:3-hydroxyisobutyrate dehydrogenase-like beta-hydroxyacid dehydrogenase